jgi:hypothetical protein
LQNDRLKSVEYKFKTKLLGSTKIVELTYKANYSAKEKINPKRGEGICS